MESKKIKNAIIIHGPGRSGTTLLNSIMSTHSDLAWISSWVNRFPSWYLLSCFNVFRKGKDGRSKLPKPTEAYHFWLHYLPQFNEKHPKFKTEDVSRLCSVLRKVQSCQGKERLLVKLTGEARAEFIDAVFENPKIIWLDREPASVIMSYYKQRWGYKNKESVFKSKSKKELIKEYFEKYQHFQKEKEHLKGFDVFYLSYEAFVEAPEKTIRDLCNFTGLEFNAQFQAYVAKRSYHSDTNTAYLKHLGEEELQYLNALISGL